MCILPVLDIRSTAEPREAMRLRTFFNNLLGKASIRTISELNGRDGGDVNAQRSGLYRHRRSDRVRPSGGGRSLATLPMIEAAGSGGRASRATEKQACRVIYSQLCRWTKVRSLLQHATLPKGNV